MKDLLNRCRTKYRLGLLHKAAIMILLTLGFFCLLNPDVYRRKWEYSPEEVTIPFLKAGDYEIKIIHYGASEGNYAIASSDCTADSENRMGVEFARTELREGIRDVAVLNVHLEEGTYGLRIWPEKESCFEEVVIQRVQLLDRDHYLLFLICFLSAACIAILGWYVPVERYKNEVILVGIGLAASVPMLSDFLLKGHDLLFHLARMEGLYQGLRSGAFPVRINPMQTELFGNLTASMYPQLFLYFAVLPRFLDVSVILCYKLLVVFMNVASAMLTFYAVRRITGSEKMAYVASVLYTFSLYRLIDTYLRAAVGEALAMVFLPLVLWGIYEVLWGEKKKWYLLALGVTCILQSHVMSVLMAVFFLVIETAVWLAASVRGKKPGREIGGRILAGVKAAAVTCLLNAWFLVPFLFFQGEKLLCFNLDYYVADFELYFSQLFSLFPSAVGEVTMMGTTKGEMPLTVGGILAVGGVLYLLAAAGENKKIPAEPTPGKKASGALPLGKNVPAEPGPAKKASALGMHCLVYGGISLLLTSWLFPWDRVGEIEFLRNLMKPLQFSWRFLGITSICLCVTSAVGVVMFSSRSKGGSWILGIFMTVALSSAWFFFDSVMLEMDSVNDEMALEANTEYDSLYLYDDRESPGPAQYEFGAAANYIKTLHGTPVRYSDYKKTGVSIHVNVAPESVPKEEEYLIFPLYYYPGYEILVDGRKVEAVALDRLLACRLPEGEAYIQVDYKGMPGWRLAELVSLVTAVGLAGYGVRQKVPARKGRRHG